MVGASYLAPCSETPLLVMAFLLACVMVVSGYWIILKWVAKVRFNFLCSIHTQRFRET